MSSHCRVGEGGKRRKVVYVYLVQARGHLGSEETG